MIYDSVAWLIRKRFCRSLQINRIFRLNGLQRDARAVFSKIFHLRAILLLAWTICHGLIIRETPGVTVVRHTMLSHGGSLWAAEKPKRGLFYSRRCTRQVAGRTAEQVFTKTAKARGPLPFYTPPRLSRYTQPSSPRKYLACNARYSFRRFLSAYF